MSELLRKYLERKYVDKNDRTVSLLFPALGRMLRNRKVWNRLNKKGKHSHHEGPVKEISVPVYEGQNTTAIKIREFLNNFKHPAIKAVLVQGSIATGEETVFSDFDGIIIIDRDAIQNKRKLDDLHKIVHESAHIMKRQDVLQHHGWTILIKQEFKRYPDAEIPSVLLEKSKVLYPATPVNFSIVIDPAFQDYKILYENLCNGIYRRLDNNKTFESYYHTKLLISECLLLPAAFLQAIYCKPVWKADSFDQIKALLTSDQYQVIESICEIRRNWGTYFNGKRKSAVHPDLIHLIQKNLNARIKDLIEVLDAALEAQENRKG